MPPIRFGTFGESYWLESYRKPRSANDSYAHGVSRLIENAGARYESGRRPHVSSISAAARSTSSENYSRVWWNTRSCANP